jgi:hypothetical protein
MTLGLEALRSGIITHFAPATEVKNVHFKLMSPINFHGVVHEDTLTSTPSPGLKYLKQNSVKTASENQNLIIE